MIAALLLLGSHTVRRRVIARADKRD
jgi:hypothetical protein